MLNFHLIFRTERKKPFEEDIDLCNVLLTYLARHESHCTTGESSNDINETDSANDLKVDEDGNRSLV